jgi:hypothetical protein
VHSSNINNLKDHEVVEEMFHAPMNMKKAITFSILFIAAPLALLSASGHILENQQVFAANPGTVGHLYEGGIPGYPYFGGYPNYGEFPYITGYGYPYNTGDHSDYGYGYRYNGDHHHHHHHHHHTY